MTVRHLHRSKVSDRAGRSPGGADGFAPFGNEPWHPAHRESWEMLAFSLASTQLGSADPAARRAAISALIVLAREGNARVRPDAARTLEQEFGPCVMQLGLAGCIARRDHPSAMDDDGPGCRSCDWQRAEADGSPSGSSDSG